MPKVVEVGSKRKNKSLPVLNETKVAKKQRGEEEVLDASNLLQNEFGSRSMSTLSWNC